MRKEINKKVKRMSDLELIHYLQDFNKQDKEGFYNEDFRKAIYDEICHRGKSRGFSIFNN